MIFLLSCNESQCHMMFSPLPWGRLWKAFDDTHQFILPVWGRNPVESPDQESPRGRKYFCLNAAARSESRRDPNWQLLLFAAFPMPAPRCISPGAVPSCSDSHALEHVIHDDCFQSQEACRDGCYSSFLVNQKPNISSKHLSLSLSLCAVSWPSY